MNPNSPNPPGLPTDITDVSEVTDLVPIERPRADGGTEVAPILAHEADPQGFQSVNGSVPVAVGQWYWVSDIERRWNTDSDGHVNVPYEWMGCVMQVGSNYLKLEEPRASGGTRTIRVHFENFWQTLRRELNPESVIQGQVAHFQGVATAHLASIQAITARLGVTRQGAIGGPGSQATQNAPTEASNALVTLSGQVDVKAYERSLVLAKETQLPELFKAVKAANEEVVRWMSASALPMLAMAQGMDGIVQDITDRIFNVSLYAGLTEQVVQCCEGEPAAFADKLHVFQRMGFMDEECLINYRHGGMEFSNIEQFDAWISEPENRDRILPFPRCLVAMRVRRSVKNRSWDGTLAGAFIKIQMAQEDKLTFLYIRNGQQVFRLSCDLEFDAKIFPDRDAFDPSEPMMVKMFAGRIDTMISRHDYEERVAADERRKTKYKEWDKANPASTWDKEKGPRDWSNPHRENRNFRPSEWVPFDPSSVYFDDIANKVSQDVKKYNRVSTILQGLFDRSAVLHPHPPVKTWTPAGFAAAIELVYDGSDALHDGEAPDFEAYRAQCNASLAVGSLVIGQDLAWAVKEAEKENKRIDNDWRSKRKGDHERFRPYGNPGPGFLARVADWKPRSRQAGFVWNRKRQTNGSPYSGERYGDPIRCTLTVPAAELFNVSAYKLGDFKRFFQDSRTRGEYLQWAPMLLTAEEYHAGNAKVIASVRGDVLGNDQEIS